MVFFKGCPLRCEWCSNPESQRFDKEIFFDSAECIDCGSCIEISHDGEFTTGELGTVFNEEKCQHPEKYENICPTKAIQVVGEEMEMNQLLKELEKDRLFYEKSGGGVTFSGGEALSQSLFLQEALQKLKSMNIHTAIETCLDVPWESIEPTLPYVNQYLIDLKHIDALKLYEYTKGEAENIHKNLKLLMDHEAHVVIRIPVIPTFNDSIEEINDMLLYVKRLGTIEEVHFLPYHTYGSKKYDLLGRVYDFNPKNLNEKDLVEFVSLAKTMGLNARIGG
jgi:pyruvate formate lyase activating enzyme